MGEYSPKLQIRPVRPQKPHSDKTSRDLATASQLWKRQEVFETGDDEIAPGNRHEDSYVDAEKQELFY
jgi:hypothetical protein